MGKTGSAEWMNFNCFCVKVRNRKCQKYSQTSILFHAALALQPRECRPVEVIASLNLLLGRAPSAVESQVRDLPRLSCEEPLAGAKKREYGANRAVRVAEGAAPQLTRSSNFG